MSVVMSQNLPHEGSPLTIHNLHVSEELDPAPILLTIELEEVRGHSKPEKTSVPPSGIGGSWK